MKHLRSLICLAFLPAIGCMSLPTQEPSAARGKEAEVIMEESTEPETIKVTADSITEDNYPQRLELLRKELTQPRYAGDNKFTFAEKK